MDIVVVCRLLHVRSSPYTGITMDMGGGLMVWVYALML